MVSEKKIVLLLDIAERALAVDLYETDRKSKYSSLVTAYQAWKENHGVGRVERNSPEWKRMQADTTAEYERFCVARDQEYNARRRLSTAIRRYHAV